MKPIKANRPPLPIAIVIFVSLVLASALAAWLLQHSQGGVFGYIRETAGWLNGGQKPEVVTWPVWGYAWVIALIPSYKFVIILQSCIGALALTALVVRFWIDMPTSMVIMVILCLLAVPWHNVQATLYPSALAGSLALLALLSLDHALDNNDTRRALLSGALMGLAQNFRSEFVLLPAFLGIIFFGLRHYSYHRRHSLPELPGQIDTSITGHVDPLMSFLEIS